MVTKNAAEIWNINSRQVANLCPEIQGALKLKGRWYIPVEAKKPLQENEKRQLLLLTLQLKNNPAQKLDLSYMPFDISDIRMIYDSLAYGKYIEPFEIDNPVEIPYKVVLTSKGFEMAMTRKNEENPYKFDSEMLKLGIELLTNLVKARICQS